MTLEMSFKQRGIRIVIELRRGVEPETVEDSCIN